MSKKNTFDTELVLKVAHLARVGLTQEEAEKFGLQLEKVLGYIEKLNELDTRNVEPLTHPIELEMPLRKDIAAESFGASKILQSAPEQVNDGYKVPQVLGGES